MRTMRSDFMIVQCPDAGVYIQEKNIAKVMGSSCVQVKYPADSNNPIYYSKFYRINGAITIDLSDLMAAYEYGVVRIAEDTAPSSTYVDVDWNVIGMRNPATAYIPSNGVTSVLPIMPPSMMLQSIGSSIEFEAWGEFDEEIRVYYEGGSSELMQSNTIPSTTDWIEIRELSDVWQHINIKPLVCGRTYALVMWTSAFGVTRRHTFEVRGRKSAVGDKINLKTNDSGYKSIKGRTESFTLFLEDLSVYDMWYYSDIITASDVSVMLDASNGEVWDQVDITTSEVTLKDGDGERGTLELNVNYKHYDAVLLQ